MALGRDGLLPRLLGRTLPRFGTPANALTALLVLSVAMVLGFGLGFQPLPAFGLLSLIVTLCALGVYTLAQIGLVRYFVRKGTFNPLWHLLVPVLAVAAIVYLYYKNVSPTPAYPNNWAIWIALIWAGLGIVGLIGLKVFRPGQLAEAATIIGEGEADTEPRTGAAGVPPRPEPSPTLPERSDGAVAEGDTVTDTDFLPRPLGRDGAGRPSAGSAHARRDPRRSGHRSPRAGDCRNGALRRHPPPRASQGVGPRPRTRYADRAPRLDRRHGHRGRHPARRRRRPRHRSCRAVDRAPRRCRARCCSTSTSARREVIRTDPRWQAGVAPARRHGSATGPHRRLDDRQLRSPGGAGSAAVRLARLPGRATG